MTNEKTTDSAASVLSAYQWGSMVQGYCFGSKNEALDYLPELIKEAGDGMEKWL